MRDEARDHWDARYRDRDRPTEPSTHLTAQARWIPESGRALDVAGGAGRHSIWLAERGLDVTLVDLSPVALELAAVEAASSGVEIHVLERDLDGDALPPGPWDVVVCFHYLQRDLCDRMARVLAPGGLLVFVAATVRNLEQFERPPLPYLLAEGEAPSLFARLDIVSYEEGWLDEGRHEARLVARRPPATGSDTLEP